MQSKSEMRRRHVQDQYEALSEVYKLLYQAATIMEEKLPTDPELPGRITTIYTPFGWSFVKESNKDEQSPDGVVRYA